MCVFAVDKAKAKVTRVYVGSLMTSMEMAGVSLTLLKVSSDSWEECLGEEPISALDLSCCVLVTVPMDASLHVNLHTGVLSSVSPFPTYVASPRGFSCSL